MRKRKVFFKKKQGRPRSKSKFARLVRIKRKIRPVRSRGRQKIASLNLLRAKENPIITPHPKNAWESKATFNPAAIYKDKKVHLLYRAIGDDDVSVFGYASSQDGFNINERLPHPAYFKKNNSRLDLFPVQIPCSSGGGWNGGCEDPRLTLIDNVVYLLYTAFDGWGSLRIALTSISLDDFLHKRWSWKKPVLISPPGEIHKNWVIFPEKIKGKYAILHSLSPKVLIDYFDSLDELEDEESTISSFYGKASGINRWDSWIRGAGPPPLKTKYGWLLLYHAIDQKDSGRYKLGVMILDKSDPTKILYRSDQPILEPDEHYENQGFKAGVVYACGAVVIDGRLFVYYGGADTVTCVATAGLENFLQALIHGRRPKLKQVHPVKS